MHPLWSLAPTLSEIVIKMEEALLMRVISSSSLILRLSSCAMVTASLSTGLSQAEMQLMKGASALTPVRLSLELGPYSVQKREFTLCKLADLGSESVGLAQPPAAAAATTKYRRIV
jgi:hypothetical protein